LKSNRQWIEGSNSFSPKSFIQFTENNDGLLANHIAKLKNIYEYAVSAIQYEVLNWKKNFEENGVINLKNIGD
jgi:hypothetical protein